MAPLADALFLMTHHGIFGIPRDIERDVRTDGEHILGDMFARAERATIDASILEIALTHVHAYEIVRCASPMT